MGASNGRTLYYKQKDNSKKNHSVLAHIHFFSYLCTVKLRWGCLHISSGGLQTYYKKRLLALVLVT